MNRIDYTEGLPRCMAALPRDAHGRPVPWFVTWFEGKPDFRIADGRKLSLAIRDGLCWACGGRLGRYRAFVIGPMCAVNRNTAEPPCHRDCAIYCATHCDFLVNPKRGRREAFKPVPDDQLQSLDEAPGVALARNPGVALVWVTRRYSLMQDGDKGVLFRLGLPEEALWYAEGRRATRAEVAASIDSGLPVLRQIAEEDGPEAVADLEKLAEWALGLYPSEATRG